MKRKEFIGTLAASVIGTSIASSVITACSPVKQALSTNAKVPPAKVDFTIDLDHADNLQLKSNGGFKVKDGVIVVNMGNGFFSALSVHCTHTGCPVVFDASSQTFPCRCHGSLFDKAGKVLQGPAASNLKQFNIQIMGSKLRVFEV